VDDRDYERFNQFFWRASRDERGNIKNVHRDVKIKTSQMIINIEPDGQISFLGDLPAGLDLPLANPRRRRVSTIQPVSLAKRWAFLFLRKVAGDTGRVAAWTRTWKCKWRATILATGQTAVFENRQAALDWEYEILTGPKFEL
jgi:hypothetical protein